MSTWLVVVVATVAGVAVTLQGTFMGTIQERLGTLEAVFITYGAGGLVIGLAMVGAGGGSLASARGMPWYTFTSGLLGLLIVGTIAFAVPRIGLVGTLSVSLVAQFALGAVLDHFGWLGASVRPLELGRAAGLAVLAVGTWLVLR